MNSHPYRASDAALLRHHGDRDAADGLLDFAVNVRASEPPAWLRETLSGALHRLAEYPGAELDRAARRAAAARHGRHEDEVLVLNGAAEGFALLPALRPRLAALVHPSFTEPEVALRAAGVDVHRVQLAAADGYALDSTLVPEAADLVVLGNPTNPTSVLHSAATLRRLARPGRLLVVDEAFADAIPGEPQSLAGERLPGLLVLRSLTKTFSIAGLRAGYAMADPDVLATLAEHRPQWPVGTLTLEAVRACCEPGAVATATEQARELEEHREYLARGIATLPGVMVAEPARAPFLLLRMQDGARVRHELRERGITVRRGDTFPGLTSDHIRVAVRCPEQSDVLLRALEEVL